MKIWIIEVVQEGGDRNMIRAFAKREDAMEKMKEIYDYYENSGVLKQTVVQLQEDDDRVSVVFYDEAGIERWDKAVMVHAEVE